MCQEHQDLSCPIHLTTTEALIVIRWIDNSPKMFFLSVLCSIINNDSFQGIGLLNKFILMNQIQKCISEILSQKSLLDIKVFGILHLFVIYLV